MTGAENPKKRLRLSLLPGRFMICRLPPDAPVPSWAMRGDFYSVTRTADELSAVCREAETPDDVRRHSGRRCMKVEGPIDFSETGILSALARPLALARISIFALSTFDTDWILVRERDLAETVRVLQEAGHEISGEQSG